MMSLAVAISGLIMNFVDLLNKFYPCIFGNEDYKIYVKHGYHSNQNSYLVFKSMKNNGSHRL